MPDEQVLHEVGRVLPFREEFHYQVILEVFQRNVYERNRPLREGEVVVDAGASIGCFTVKASLEVGERGHVYAFEPEPENYGYLEKNIERYPNVTAFNKALWSASERKPFYVRGDHWAGHSFFPYGRTRQIIEVDAVTLDEAVSGDINFLKVDVESAELEVLKGAKRILAESKPYIAMETHEKQLFGEIADFLRGYSYAIVGELNPYGTGVHYFQ